ncbi:MAG: iron chelate uptake ABC transporter family permease subunit, partial [Gammaproteobacteria bacterium]|nr:iron chelate uptake ABC transporter family permease subunit [Gammaproteobacteria bacterium]
MEKSLNPLLIFLVIFISWLSLGSGSIEVNVVSGLWDWLNSIDNNDALIIGEIRLPRTLLALVVGAAMGLSGAALQGLLRNPLVDPGLIGASQGAALGAACVFYFNL